MVNQLNINNFFTQYINHPLADELSHTDQLLATISSIAIAIIFLGTVHLTVYSLTKCNIISLQPQLEEPNILDDEEAYLSKSEPPLNFEAINKIIKALQEDSISHCQKKGNLLKAALDLLPADAKQLEFYKFSNKQNQKFKLSNTTKPAYFAEKFKAKNIDKIALHNTSSYYDYENSKGHEHYWVDFANQYLGGGCFSTVCVQEEIMVAEMPDFAAWIASDRDNNPQGFLVRRGSDKHSASGVLEGSPTPCAFKNVHRVIAYNNTEAYGSKFYDCPPNKLFSPLDKAQVVNVIGVAAPCLSGTDPKLQFKANTLKDVFNTIMAAFELTIHIEKESGKTIHIHSGKLGCGVFGNHPLALYLMHRLALTHLSNNNLELTLHDYSDEEALERCEKTWNKLVTNGIISGDKSLEQCIDDISNYLLNT